MTIATKRVLPADVYDALAESAEKFDGIGYGVVSLREKPDVPICILGHCNAVDFGGPRNAGFHEHGAATRALLAAIAPTGQWYEVGDVNDDTVRAINQRKGTWSDARVSFAEWCAELGVERGT